MMKIQNLIDGQLCDPHERRWLDVVEPATAAVYARCADSTEADVEKAVTAARSAFPRWSKLEGAQRAAHLNRLADWIAAHAQELAHDESRDAGKTLEQASKVEIPRAEANLRFFASLAMTFASECHPMSSAINFTLRSPLGVVGSISPWNLPLYLLTWKIAPALAAGNCVVAKPSELTPLTAFRLAQATIETGFPSGVLNIIQGSGSVAGDSLVGQRDVRAITFTGGTKTGAVIAAKTAVSFKKTSLELGGKNPNVIFADCDYDKMLATTLRSSFANQGQICLCGSRIYVQQSIYKRFRDDFVQAAKAWVVGDPLEPGVQVGAVVSHAHLEKVLNYIELARQEGGTVLCGGQRVIVPGRCQNGFFIAPTVVEGLNSSCRSNQEEIFGPVVTIEPFETVDQAIELANGTDYGLSASIWTQDIDTAHRVAEALDAGVVWVNCWLIRDLRTPFGGVKHSGLGREGGLEAMRFFTETKNICVQYGSNESASAATVSGTDLTKQSG